MDLYQRIKNVSAISGLLYGSLVLADSTTKPIAPDLSSIKKSAMSFYTAAKDDDGDITAVVADDKDSSLVKFISAVAQGHVFAKHLAEDSKKEFGTEVPKSSPSIKLDRKTELLALREDIKDLQSEVDAGEENVTGDTGTLTFKDTDGNSHSFEFRNVNGEWKLNLAKSKDLEILSKVQLEPLIKQFTVFETSFKDTDQQLKHGDYESLESLRTGLVNNMKEATKKIGLELKSPAPQD